jgi:hypothetical protein
MNNFDDNCVYKEALEKIKRDKKCKPDCCSIVSSVGPTGPTGPAGPTGETPTITIGAVTTGEPGTDAAATITGIAPNFVLNLTIPQGPTGPTP